MKKLLFIFSFLIAQYSLAQLKIEPTRIGMFVSNVDKASSWYENNLGFKTYKKLEFPEYDSTTIAFIKNGQFEIELIQKSTSFPIESIKPDYDLNKEPVEGIFKITFRVTGIQQVYNKLKENGVKEIIGLTYDKEFNQNFFIVADFDGNFIQLIESPRK